MSDAAARLEALDAYEEHYKGLVTKGDGFSFVTHAEMAQILEDVTELFKSIGVGLRKNEIGQALPKRRGWERHG